MRKLFPWDDDYDSTYQIIDFPKIEPVQFYGVRQNFGDIPDDAEGNAVDFVIVKGTEKELIEMGCLSSSITTNEDLSLLIGMLHEGYFDEIAKDCNAYNHMRKRDKMDT